VRWDIPNFGYFIFQIDFTLAIQAMVPKLGNYPSHHFFLQLQRLVLTNKNHLGVDMAWHTITESITVKTIVKTTPTISNANRETEKEHKTTIKLTTIRSSKLAHGRILLSTNELIENSPCTFQGNMPDQDSCQCRKMN
jgi:hypothetical protein